MLKKTVKIINETGFHARPVTQFVSLGKTFESTIYLDKAGKTARGDSIISIMSLGIAFDDEITVSAEGVDAEQAVSKMADFLASFKE